MLTEEELLRKLIAWAGNKDNARLIIDVLARLTPAELDTLTPNDFQRMLADVKEYGKP